MKELINATCEGNPLAATYMSTKYKQKRSEHNTVPLDHLANFCTSIDQDRRDRLSEPLSLPSHRTPHQAILYQQKAVSPGPPKPKLRNMLKGTGSYIRKPIQLKSCARSGNVSPSHACVYVARATYASHLGVVLSALRRVR